MPWWYGEGFCLSEALGGFCDVHHGRVQAAREREERQIAENPASRSAPLSLAKSTEQSKPAKGGKTPGPRGRLPHVSEGMKTYWARRQAEKAAGALGADQPAEVAGAPRPAPMPKTGDQYPVEFYPKTPDERKLLEKLGMKGGDAIGARALRLWRCGWNFNAIQAQLAMPAPQ